MKKIDYIYEIIAVLSIAIVPFMLVYLLYQLIY